MLSKYNDLFDPLMGRSVCITGQLRLLELAIHLVRECSSLKIVQLNTDGIMVSLSDDDLERYDVICQEWQDRTGFELEEDTISEIIQKDVNNYVEIAIDGSTKIKGGQLVRGIAPAGAFNINNNATIVAKAILDYFARVCRSKIPSIVVTTFSAFSSWQKHRVSTLRLITSLTAKKSLFRSAIGFTPSKIPDTEHSSRLMPKRQRCQNRRSP